MLSGFEPADIQVNPLSKARQNPLFSCIIFVYNILAPKALEALLFAVVPQLAGVMSQEFGETSLQLTEAWPLYQVIFVFFYI